MDNYVFRKLLDIRGKEMQDEVARQAEAGEQMQEDME